MVVLTAIGEQARDAKLKVHSNIPETFNPSPHQYIVAKKSSIHVDIGENKRSARFTVNRSSCAYPVAPVYFVPATRGAGVAVAIPMTVHFARQTTVEPLQP